LRAGADGKALVPVVVPPGVDFAQQGERLIDLHVPRTRTVQLGPIAAGIPIDRDRDVDIAIAAVTRTGEPRVDAPLQLTVSRGVVGAAEPLVPGLYRVRWQVPAGLPGEAVLTATVAGDPSPSEIAVRLIPGPVASIEFQSAQAAAPGVPVELTALVNDAAGNGADEPVEFFASAGNLSSSPTGVGRYRLVLTPPPLDESAELTVTAATRRGADGPTASVQVNIVPRVEEDREPRPRWAPRTVAVRTGFFAGGHGLDAPVLGLEGTLRRRWRALQAALVADLWWARARQTTTMAPAVIDARDDFFVGSLSGSLRLSLSDRSAVWAQAGAALVGASARVAVTGPTQGESTSRGAVPGIEIGFGAERRMWGGVPFLDVRVLRTASFALPNLVGALTAFTVCAGYRLEMP
jgi:hypothetical protein